MSEQEYSMWEMNQIQQHLNNVESELELAQEEISILTGFNNSMTRQYVAAMRLLSPEQRREVRRDTDSEEDDD